MEIIFKKLTEVAITNGKILISKMIMKKTLPQDSVKKTFCNSEKLENICHTKITLTTKTKMWFWKIFKVRKELSWRPQL